MKSNRMKRKEALSFGSSSYCHQNFGYVSTTGITLHSKELLTYTDNKKALVCTKLYSIFFYFSVSLLTSSLKCYYFILVYAKQGSLNLRYSYTTFLNEVRPNMEIFPQVVHFFYIMNTKREFTTYLFSVYISPRCGEVLFLLK